MNNYNYNNKIIIISIIAIINHTITLILNIVRVVGMVVMDHLPTVVPITIAIVVRTLVVRVKTMLMVIAPPKEFKAGEV